LLIIIKNSSKIFLAEQSANLIHCYKKKNHNIFSPLQKKISEALPNCYVFGVFKSFSDFFIHLIFPLDLLANYHHLFSGFKFEKEKKCFRWFYTENNYPVYISFSFIYGTG
jgi:hypothetical protein